MKFSPLMLIIAELALSSTSFADREITVPMSFTVEKGVGKAAGSIVISKTQYGVLFTPNLHGLTPGFHGFHIHEVDSCEKNGMAAGGHFDPYKTGKHRGPYRDEGHLGDLPVIMVSAEGIATTAVLAPRIKNIEDIRHRSLMLHDGGDNYSDEPNKLGGGGGRMVCGVITETASK